MSINALKMPLSTTIGRHAIQKSNDYAHVPAKGLPCRVVKIEKDIVEIAFEGSNGVWNMPHRKIPQAFSPYGRDPTQVGDKGFASPSDYYTGGVTGLGGGQSNWGPRGNLTPLSFHPLSKKKPEERDYDQYTGAGGPKGLKLLQEAKQPKDDQKPPDTPTPKMVSAMAGWGTAAKASWLRHARSRPVPEPQAEEKDERSFMELDKEGVVTHSSKSGKHAAIIDEGGKKIALKVPANDSTAWLGGTGKQSDLYGAVMVMTPAGMMPSVNVKAKWQHQDD